MWRGIRKEFNAELLAFRVCEPEEKSFAPLVRTKARGLYVEADVATWRECKTPRHLIKFFGSKKQTVPQITESTTFTSVTTPRVFERVRYFLFHAQGQKYAEAGWIRTNISGAST